MLRQLHFATVDLELHSSFRPGGSESIFDVDRRVAVRAAPCRPSGPFLARVPHPTTLSMGPSLLRSILLNFSCKTASRSILRSTLRSTSRSTLLF